MTRFITAGAGSGKTYTVTTEVARRVKEEGLRPEQVIMTTYTKAAAQELREKAKQALIDLGLNKEALEMEHALIGTVHSVANTFLTKYWYLLGIMPDAAALENDELQLYRDESLRGLLESADRTFIYRYCEKYEIKYSYDEGKTGLNYEFWKNDLCKVLDYMQWYNISDEQLEKSLTETSESIIKLLEPREKDVNIRNLIPGIIEDILGVINASKKPGGVMKKQKEFVNALKVDNISEEELEDLSVIVKNRCKDTDKGKAFLKAYDATSLLKEEFVADHREYAKMIFRLANCWRKMYRTFKDEHHLIDFNDMEEMFLRLLDMEEVRKDIKARYACIYVDEFQDSNPMQVRIFQKLSEIIEACYVGDKKQAIYGFRGSDTELTTAVADSIQEKSSLPHSYRSIEPLVNLSNKVFTKVFEGMSDVTLSMPPEEKRVNRSVVERPLRLWQWDKETDLALQIQQLILREKIECNKIAVLACRNSELDKLADELRNIGVPVCRENDNIKDTRTGRLVKALLTLMTTPGNLLAKAEIAYLTEREYNVTKIIEERLDNISSKESQNKDYLREIPIISRLEKIRNQVKFQSVSALLETLVIELNLYALVQRWDNALAEESNLQAFIDLAKSYEETAIKIGHPATIAGFIDYFCNKAQKGAADNSGVRLFTYHKSKGLEWDVVIMLSLNKDLEDYNNMAKKCMLGCHNHRTERPTPKNFNPPMTISLVRDIYTPSGSRSTLPSIIQSRLQEHPDWDNICQAEKEEQSRLLYVGVTRARNILVLAAKGKDNAINLNWFRTTSLKEVHQTLTNDSMQDVLGIGIPFAVEKLDKEHLEKWPEQENGKVFDIASDYSSLENTRNLSPSKAGKTHHDLGKILNAKEHRIPESVPQGDREAYARMGDFIHQVFCCMDDGIPEKRIEQLRNDYGFTEKNMPEPCKLIDAWNYLTQVLEKEYGPSVNRIHEMPFRHYDEKGHIVSGYIDFIWETEDAYVVVDYKTCASDYKLIFNPENEHYAGNHGDQLDCYQRALEADGKKHVRARLIYYPITRFLIEVK